MCYRSSVLAVQNDIYETNDSSLNIRALQNLSASFQESITRNVSEPSLEASVFNLGYSNYITLFSHLRYARQTRRTLQFPRDVNIMEANEVQDPPTENE